MLIGRNANHDLAGFRRGEYISGIRPGTQLRPGVFTQLGGCFQVLQVSQRRISLCSAVFNQLYGHTFRQTGQVIHIVAERIVVRGGNFGIEQGVIAAGGNHIIVACQDRILIRFPILGQEADFNRFFRALYRGKAACAVIVVTACQQITAKSCRLVSASNLIQCRIRG